MHELDDVSSASEDDDVNAYEKQPGGNKGKGKGKGKEVDRGQENRKDRKDSNPPPNNGDAV